MNHDRCTKFLHALTVLSTDSEALDHVISENDTVLFARSQPSFAIHHTAADGRTGKRPVFYILPNAATLTHSAAEKAESSEMWQRRSDEGDTL